MMSAASISNLAAHPTSVGRSAPGWGLCLLACWLVSAGCNGSWSRVEVDPEKAFIDARATLTQAVDAEGPVTRAQALEALAQVLPRKAAAPLLQGLSDPKPVVRFAAAMGIGDIRLARAKPILERMAERSEPDRRVLCAVIYALHQLGNDAWAGQLAELLSDREPEVRADAAMAMGKMDEPTAVGPLKSLLADERNYMVQVQVREALAMLGDATSRNVLEAYTKMPYLDDRLRAIQAITRVPSPRSVGLFRDLLGRRHPTRVRAAAAGALARLGQVDEQGYRFCYAAAQDPVRTFTEALGPDHRPGDREISSLRQIAAQSLGWMRREPAANVLQPLLASPDGSVRVAAAMSLLRILHRFRRPPPTTTAPHASGGSAASRPASARKTKLFTAGGKD